MINQLNSKQKLQLRRNKNSKNETGTNKGFNDNIDDLLSDLMSKQQMKKSRRNVLQPYSSQNLGATGFDTFNKTTDKFSNQNIQSDINFNYGLSKGGNKGSKKSLLDDLMSEDNKSYKSGVTGRRQHQTTDNFNFIKNNQPQQLNQTSQQNVSIRGGMRPPLKKKAQSRQPSIFNDDNKSVSRMNDNLNSVQDLDIISVTPKMPKRFTMQPQKTEQQQIKFDLSPSKEKPFPRQGQFQVFANQQKPLFLQDKPIYTQKPLIQQQPIIQQKIIEKIIHVKQDNKQLTQRHQQQLKILKQSYQRQIENLKSTYQKTTKDEQQTRKLMMKTFQENIQGQKKKWQKIVQNETQRIKQIYEWENKKKAESYQLEVKKLKQLLDTISKSQQKRSTDQSSSINNQVFNLQYSLRLKQLEKQKQRIQQKTHQLQTKRRFLQSQQHQFELYRRKQDNRLSQEKKKLYEYETQIRKREVQVKKQFLTEKQSLASQLVQNELHLNQTRENLRHEYDKLNLERQLFSQQKSQFEKINNKILSDLKQRQKNLQVERQQLNNLQVQVYKKLNTIQMMAAQKGLSTNSKNMSLNGTIGRTMKRSEAGHRSISLYQQNHKQNNRNRINSQLDNKINDTKNRYAQMEELARNNNLAVKTHSNNGSKIHLEKYIEKLSKDKFKLH